METFLGVKVISAGPMDECSFLRDQKKQDVTNRETREGYLVIYQDGYTSWSPKDVFEKAYRRIEALTFGLVIEALKTGKRAARKGWNGAGMFIFLRPADELHIDMVIDKVKSLPQSVKDYYLQDVLDASGNRLPADEHEKVKFTTYLCMKAADGTIVNGWLASQTDMLSEDWMILD